MCGLLGLWRVGAWDILGRGAMGEEASLLSLSLDALMMSSKSDSNSASASEGGPGISAGSAGNEVLGCALPCSICSMAQSCAADIASTSSGMRKQSRMRVYVESRGAKGLILAGKSAVLVRFSGLIVHD